MDLHKGFATVSVRDEGGTEKRHLHRVTDFVGYVPVLESSSGDFWCAECFKRRGSPLAGVVDVLLIWGVGAARGLTADTCGAGAAAAVLAVSADEHAIPPTEGPGAGGAVVKRPRRSEAGSSGGGQYDRRGA